MTKFITRNGQRVPIKKGLTVQKFVGLKSDQLLVSEDGDINTKYSISNLLDEGIKSFKVPSNLQPKVIKDTIRYHRVYTGDKKASGWDKTARWAEGKKK